MASTRLDLPAPVGPVNANRSAPSKSTTVGSRKAVKPSTSSRLGRMGLVQQLGEQLVEPLVGDPLVAEVLAEQLLRRPARPSGGPALPIIAGGRRLLDDHVDRLGKKCAHLV